MPPPLVEVVQMKGIVFVGLSLVAVTSCSTILNENEVPPTIKSPSPESLKPNFENIMEKLTASLGQDSGNKVPFDFDNLMKNIDPKVLKGASESLMGGKIPSAESLKSVLNNPELDSIFKSFLGKKPFDAAAGAADSDPSAGKINVENIFKSFAGMFGLDNENMNVGDLFEL